MDNYENNNSDEYTNSSEEESNQPRTYDPAGETKTKIIFFVVIVAIMVSLKYILGY